MRTVRKRQNHHGDSRKLGRNNPKTHANKPCGRDAVVVAAIEAATVLFAARGPASVSIRDIAALAGINHALVHRHFGTKRAVLQAVLKRTVDEAMSVVDDITMNDVGMERLFNIAADHSYYWQALARAILDGEEPGHLQRGFPVVQRMIASLRSERRNGSRAVRSEQTQFDLVDERVMVASAIALMFGWLLYEPFLLKAAGLNGGNRGKTRRWITRLMGVLINVANKLPPKQPAAGV
jgi:AcrR family transcriptional regulator